MTSIAGLLLLDKPKGPTSHDLVARARRLLGVRRAGHTGTLDPAATGLLLLLIGPATRLARFVPGSPKLYVGSIRLGIATDTDDTTGKALSTHSGALPDPDAVRRAASAFLGRSMQRPPDFSARSVGGERLYRLARRGAIVDAPPREVEVFRFDVTPGPDAGLWNFEALVSEGTYVRSLARDLGSSLGCGGSLAELRRTRIGPFPVERAIALPSSGPATGAPDSTAWIPVDSIPLICDDVRLDRADATKFVHGIPVAHPSTPLGDGELRAVRSAGGSLLGVGEARQGRLEPRVVLGTGSEDGGLPPENGVW